jgi:hypothetical protein
METDELIGMGCFTIIWILYLLVFAFAGTSRKSKPTTNENN